jgi:hypothetical protein
MLSVIADCTADKNRTEHMSAAIRIAGKEQEFGGGHNPRKRFAVTDSSGMGVRTLMSTNG